MKQRTPAQTELMHKLLQQLPLLEVLAMQAGLPITRRAIQNAVRAAGWEAAGETERANRYAPNTEASAPAASHVMPPKGDSSNERKEKTR